MGKVAIVTGASRGIGAATALILAEQGYKVCVNYRSNSQQANLIVDTIKHKGGEAIALGADVSVEQEVFELFDRVERKLGQVTHLVNNAGILSTQSCLKDISYERFLHIVNTNLGSCFLCCREAATRMQSGGAIVNVSSKAAATGSPFEYIDYAASKGAMDTLSKGLSVELAAQGIRVNTVRPGLIHTDMHADGGEPNRAGRLGALSPIGRGGQANEVASAIAYLLSEQASYITGSVLDVTGGR